MKAILMTGAGGPEVLQQTEIPTPEIQHNSQILVRLYAAGVNPIDTKLRKRGTFYPDQMPAVLGCDGAGVVEAVGTNVQRFSIGDNVYFCNGGLGAGPGNYAEFALVDERFVASKPESLSFAAAAAAPLVLITAWEALYDRGHLEAGRQVLIHAGAGGVGHVAIQLARLSGATVYTTVSTVDKAEFVQQFGAEPIFYTQVDVASDVLNRTNGEGVDLGLDTVGGGVLSQTFAATKIYGDVVTLHSPNPNTDWKTARNRNLRISYELMLTPMLSGLIEAQSDQAKILQQCARLIDQGDLNIVLNQTFPLAAAAEAHRRLEEGAMVGKVALLIRS